MTNEIGWQAARVVNALEVRAGTEQSIGQAQLESARAQFLQLGPALREAVLDTLRDPSHPVADRALVEGVEQGFAAYVEARRGYSGLRTGQRIAQVSLFIDRDVNITGAARGFTTLADAQTAARAVARDPDRDAAVFRAPDGTFVMHPVSDVTRLNRGPNAQVHDVENPNGYRLISLATNTGLITLAQDHTRLDTPYGREVLAALRSGRPITAVTGHGVVYVSKGKLPDGTLPNSVGGGLLRFTHVTSDDMLTAANAGRINSRVLFMLGCNTAEYNGTPTAMGAAFLKSSGARAFVGSRGFMQNGAEIVGMDRMLASWRVSPGTSLTDIVAQENVYQRRNMLQDAELVIVGDGAVTYDELMR